jgi:hypothetical protein
MGRDNMHRTCGAGPDRSPGGWPAGPVSKSAGNPLSGVNAFDIARLSKPASQSPAPPGEFMGKGLRVHAFGGRTAIRIVVVMS